MWSRRECRWSSPRTRRPEPPVRRPEQTRSGDPVLTNAQPKQGSIVPRGVAAALVAALAIVAWLAPRFPFTSPYETTANRTIVPGCGEVQCFRVLVPWILGLIPVTSVLKWKAFAVVFDVAAAFAVFDL